MKDNKTEYFRIKLADVKIEVECNYRLLLYQCRDYLAQFENPDFLIRVSMDEIIAERKEVPDILDHDPGISVNYADAYTELQIAYRKIANKMLDFDTILMHGSVVAKDKLGYLFSAPSGVGKTTRTKLWLDLYPDSFVVNGDKPLLKITETEVIAYGTPWCGEEGWNTNIGVPLQAIFFLERADEDKKNSIEEINLGNAFKPLIHQIGSPPDSISLWKTIELLKAFGNKVKLYRFCSTPTPEAIHLAYETARPR